MSSDMIIVDDIEGPPLPPEKREQLLRWFREHVELGPKYVFHTTVLPNGDTITSVKPREGGMSALEAKP